MWTYWTLLTDLKQSEVEASCKAAVASGAEHPMEVKKRLARTIVAGFHSEEAAQKRRRELGHASSSATRRRKTSTRSPYPGRRGRLDLGGRRSIRLDKLLVRLGPGRLRQAMLPGKSKQGAVRIDGEPGAGNPHEGYRCRER